MMATNKRYLKEDQDCIKTCITAIEKLEKVYWKSTSGDSVAEGEAKKAISRVLTFIVRFIED
jgi:hypothetical protein